MIKLSDVLVDRAKTPFAVRRNKPSVSVPNFPLRIGKDIGRLCR